MTAAELQRGHGSALFKGAHYQTKLSIDFSGYWQQHFAPTSKNMTVRMKRFAIATVIIALLTVSAYSQQGNAPITARTDKEKKADAAIEKAYEDTLKRERSNGPAVKSDPWQTIRPAGGDNTKH